MALILANDGIDAAGRILLEQAGHEVQTNKVAQNELAAYIFQHNVAAILVRSATLVTEAELQTGKLKVVGRAGVGMDNIDLKCAEKLGIPVVNTPASSSRSVAELVIAHALGLLRFLPESNRAMPNRREPQTSRQLEEAICWWSRAAKSHYGHYWFWADWSCHGSVGLRFGNESGGI
jgi:phosphoglycerate dehydrogenase-like enzyme